MKIAYLFSFEYWQFSPPRYILVHAINEEEARNIACKNLSYNSGERAKPNDVKLVTYGL